MCAWNPHMFRWEDNGWRWGSIRVCWQSSDSFLLRDQSADRLESEQVLTNSHRHFAAESTGVGSTGKRTRTNGWTMHTTKHNILFAKQLDQLDGVNTYSLHLAPIRTSRSVGKCGTRDVDNDDDSRSMLMEMMCRYGGNPGRRLRNSCTLRIRPCTPEHAAYTTVFRRDTWLRITVIVPPVVHARLLL